MLSNEDDENDKTLMSSNEDDEKENEDNDDETISQNKKNIKIKNINDYLDEITDKPKSFQDKIESIRKLENLDEYWFSDDYGNKELKFKYFKLKLKYKSNEIDKKLFEQIFGHTLINLANKLINTKNKEENQITVNNINKIKNAINLILDFNKTN